MLTGPRRASEPNRFLLRTDSRYKPDSGASHTPERTSLPLVASDDMMHFDADCQATESSRTREVKCNTVARTTYQDCRRSHHAYLRLSPTAFG